MSCRKIVVFLSCILWANFACSQDAGIRSRFDEWDVNLDGMLTRQELPAPLRKNFEKVDTNNDGKISRKEDSAFLNRGRLRNQNQQDGIKVHSNISYAKNQNPRQMLDLYLPEKTIAENIPVIVFIHGGGWRNGNKNSGVNRLRKFVASGNYAGVSVGYRLSGESIWPSQIHDCKAAIRWIRANAEKYHLDENRIGVWGTSAGGHLVSMLGTSAENESMNGSVGPYSKISSHVACVVDFFGPTDLLQMNKTAIPGAKLDHDAPNSPESLLLGGPLQKNPKKAATANPVTYIHEKVPPFLIVHGTLDPLVSHQQSEMLHQALKESGNSSALITVEGGGHGKGFGPDVDLLIEKFFDHHLRGKTVPWQDRTIPAVKR